MSTLVDRFIARFCEVEPRSPATADSTRATFAFRTPPLVVALRFVVFLGGLGGDRCIQSRSSGTENQ